MKLQGMAIVGGLLGVLLSLAGCTQDDGEPAVEARIDTVEWAANHASFEVFGDHTVISAFRANETQQSSFELIVPGGRGTTGTFALPDTSAEPQAHFEYRDGNTGYTADSGAIVIDQFSGGEINGSFRGRVANDDTSFIVTEGVLSGISERTGD